MWHSGKMQSGRTERRSLVPRLSLRGWGNHKGVALGNDRTVWYDTVEVNI